MATMLGIFRTEEIIDKICEMDRQKKYIDENIKIYQAELQKRGMRVIEEKNIKQTVMYGNNNNRAEITYTQGIDIINFYSLKSIAGKELIEENVQRTCEFKYKFDTKFAEVIKAIFTDDYTEEMIVADILNCIDGMDKQSLNLLMKKLKGEYKKDRELIITTLRLPSNADLDVELDYIHKAIMWERIKMYFPDNTKKVIEGIKKSLIVTQTPKLAIKYEE